jgi:hypothetical protein
MMFGVSQRDSIGNDVTVILLHTPFLIPRGFFSQNKKAKRLVVAVIMLLIVSFQYDSKSSTSIP